MTQTGTPTFPAYDQACENRGNHSLDHLAGYDILVTAVIGGTQTRVRVADTYQGAASYGDALAALKPIRAGAASVGGWAYIGQAWQCGCRQVGRVARTGGCVYVP